MDFSKETNLRIRNFTRVCGIDEAGRGSLAGPLIAGAVILDLEKADQLEGVKDSKQLKPEKREELLPLILENAVAWSIGVVHNTEIDKHGLSFANKIAMKRAWKYLKVKPDYILADYMSGVHFETPFELIKHGDREVLSIAAASIIAKVFHDRMIRAFAKVYPQYEFAEHMAYGTALHIAKIKEYGPCPIHRMSYEPLKAKLF